MSAPFLFALIFLVPTVFLLFGRWSWIIPGYNILPESEKRKFDEPKLCRAVGLMMLTMTVGFAVSGVADGLVQTGRATAPLSTEVRAVFLCVALAHGLFTYWYARTRCR